MTSQKALKELTSRKMPTGNPRLRKTIYLHASLIALSLSFSVGTVVKAEELLYQTPQKNIADLVNVPPTPSVMVFPDKTKMLILEQPAAPGIAEISQPELRLAGLRINPKTSSPSRQSHFTRIFVKDLGDEKAEPQEIVGTPPDAHIASVHISVDCKYAAFTVTTEKGVELWIADLAAKKSHKLIQTYLNAAVGAPFTWLSDGTIVAKLIPADRGAQPTKNPVPMGPLVQENDGRKRPSHTEPDMLKDAFDEKLFDYFVQSQLAHITTDGVVQLIGHGDAYLGMDASPDAKHLLIARTHHPYSYKVGLERFPRKVEVWTPSGTVEKQLADKPLAEEVPIDFCAVETGPRDYQWRSDTDATVAWVEARDGGDPKTKVDVRDELFMWAAPFAGSPTKLAQFGLRFSGVDWGTGQLALISEYWWKDRRTHTYIIAPDDQTKEKRLLWDLNYQDRYKNPGNPLHDVTAKGHSVIHQNPDGTLLLAGAGASEAGDHPFLDTLELKDLKTSRIWQCEDPHFESISTLLDKSGDKYLTRREAVAEQPQFYIRKLSDHSLRRLTDFPNPNPEFASVTKKLIQYQRNDGVKLSGMLYLPPGFKLGETKPAPLLMWAYPAEFKSKETAGQVQDSKFRFVRASYGGPLFALLMGFAVLDNPQFPIVGEGKTEPNDTYVQQLVASAQAAADEVVSLGAADRDRLAIGGHSYGAFTTANLLAHSDIFRAGIARSGAYNRTLTPFGFQAEERTFWQAKDTYIEMSPFTFADKINKPLLMIHGEVDNNPGTFPIQSERLFEAMKGLGGRVRWVVLPAEMHGYMARESNLHMLWEMSQWLDKYVKNAPTKQAVTATPAVQ